MCTTCEPTVIVSDPSGIDVTQARNLSDLVKWLTGATGVNTKVLTSASDTGPKSETEVGISAGDLPAMSSHSLAFYAFNEFPMKDNFTTSTVIDEYVVDAFKNIITRGTKTVDIVPCKPLPPKYAAFLHGLIGWRFLTEKNPGEVIPGLDGRGSFELQEVTVEHPSDRVVRTIVLSKEKYLPDFEKAHTETIQAGVRLIRQEQFVLDVTSDEARTLASDWNLEVSIVEQSLKRQPMTFRYVKPEGPVITSGKRPDLSGFRVNPDQALRSLRLKQPYLHRYLDSSFADKPHTTEYVALLKYHLVLSYARMALNDRRIALDIPSISVLPNLMAIVPIWSVVQFDILQRYDHDPEEAEYDLTVYQTDSIDQAGRMRLALWTHNSRIPSMVFTLFGSVVVIGPTVDDEVLAQATSEGPVRGDVGGLGALQVGSQTVPGLYLG